MWVSAKKILGLLLSLVFLVFPIFSYAQIPAKGSFNITVQVRSNPSSPSSPPPMSGGGVTYYSPANIIFEGRAYPFAYITLLKNGAVASTFQASSSGSFKREITGLREGFYNFGIFAEDNKKRKSVTLNFNVGVISGKIITVSGIFISPTISLEATKIKKGNSLNIFGQSFPNSRINIFISSSQEIVKETTTTKDGNWSFKLNTDSLTEGKHRVRVKAIYKEGEQSPFSQTLSFLILPQGTSACRGADLNFDGKIDIVDFSILLYFWGQNKPINACADINSDGIVDIVDFSIMMYYWSP